MGKGENLEDEVRVISRQGPDIQKNLNLELNGRKNELPRIPTAKFLGPAGKKRHSREGIAYSSHTLTHRVMKKPARSRVAISRVCAGNSRKVNPKGVQP